MSSSTSSSKKYGLILSDKSRSQQLTFQASRNVFGNDSDSEDESKKKPVLLRPSHNIKRQAKIAQDKAVIEDPTVYQYDEIYDTMASKKEDKKIKSQEERKPRYIENLLKTANKRKIENERRVERQIQKEREKEGDEFADKEVFVTSAYKKKLEEMHEEEEKEKREEYLESIGDVTKQRDLGGFYRHLYEVKLGSIKNVENLEKQDANKAEKTSTNENNEKDGSKSLDKSESSKRRNYRKRKASSDVKRYLSEGEIEDSDDEINRVNLKDIKLAKKVKSNEENIDADSDFSIDESSDDESIPKDVKQSGEVNPKTSDTSSTKEILAKPDVKDKDKDNQKQVKFENNDLEAVLKPKQKIDIWKKRTVGEVFEQALKRYYERKAARGS